MDESPELAALGVAAFRVLHLQNELRRAERERDAALVAIHKSGVPKCHTAATAREYLALHGFDARQIGRLAISRGSVRLVLDGRRSPVLSSSVTPGPSST